MLGPARTDTFHSASYTRAALVEDYLPCLLHKFGTDNVQWMRARTFGRSTRGLVHMIDTPPGLGRFTKCVTRIYCKGCSHSAAEVPEV